VGWNAQASKFTGKTASETDLGSYRYVVSAGPESALKLKPGYWFITVGAKRDKCHYKIGAVLFDIADKTRVNTGLFGDFVSRSVKGVSGVGDGDGDSGVGSGGGCGGDGGDDDEWELVESAASSGAVADPKGGGSASGLASAAGAEVDGDLAGPPPAYSAASPPDDAFQSEFMDEYVPNLSCKCFESKMCCFYIAEFQSCCCVAKVCLVQCK
jgi:hypothetical protein